LYTQLLAARYPEGADEDVETFVRFILDGSQQMRALIDNLLSFSRAQGSALVLRSTEMGSVVDATLSNLRSSIEESGAKITYDGLPRVTVDGARFVQVFQNLVGNGIKYRRPGTTPHVHISAVRQSPKEWLFTVEDNGAGFEPRYGEQIFGLFKRLHGKEIPGTGIGLAICRKIVEAHGGRIWATSTPGVGSRFQFTIPDRPAS
jgi:light-regulated signal transduction histidine kinase (bacteriophytochrome)